MYVVNNEYLCDTRGILGYIPSSLRRYMMNIDLSRANEIHMRLGKPLCIRFADGHYYLNSNSVLSKNPSGAVRVTRAHIDEAVELAAKSSMYSVKDELKNGYITINGGHRIGITGTPVIRRGEISYIKNISALNYRLANEIIGAADSVMDKILCGKTVRNTLIVSPPGAGKTTMLRDIARQLSKKGYRISIVDERREIAAMNEGRTCFDLGISSDVMDGAPKAEAMLMMLRSMAPDVIITDEIGKSDDIFAIERIINCGVKIITTIHGEDMAQIEKRNELRGMMRFFDLVITLSKRNGIGTVEEAVLR